MMDSCRITIKTVENGYVVDIPDMDAMKTAEVAAKKKGNPTPYMGDMMKSYTAKSIKEVQALVKAALNKMPENEFDAAFEEAAAEAKN